MTRLLCILLTLLFSPAGPALGEYGDLEQSSLAAKTGDVKYHYTKADDASFKEGLYEGSSVTDKLYDDAVQAGSELGIPTPTRVIPIKDGGNFVPAKPPIVEEVPNRGFKGGGTAFNNPTRVPPEDILPSQPIGGGR